jgi:Mlc titration factor MtfA (ptsG expression regulator)
MIPNALKRCYEAAKDGADGSAHEEVINDWRDAFRAYTRDRSPHNPCERFEAAVEAYFDSVEEWHEKNGTLYQEIG